MRVRMGDRIAPAVRGACQVAMPMGQETPVPPSPQ